MGIPELLAWLEASGPAVSIRDSLYLFPLIESAHVIGLAMVFGTIAIVDLRLLGIASTRRPFSKIASDIMKWTWAAFVVTVVTGLLMFITNAAVYYHNTSFRWKMALLACAGINMLIFERTAARSVGQWDRNAAAPRAGRTAAAVSLVLWIGIIFLGRWVGFTTTQTNLKPDTEFDIDALFPPSADEASSSKAPR
jgi:peptidoglycan/LPS O-acetylase OafA/YrhL